jgi:glutaminase
MDWPTLLADVYAYIQPSLGQGRVANYIPALANADPRAFALSVATLDGQVHSVGQSSRSFSIQSISKVFTLTLAMQWDGEALWQRVGREPSGSSFNSIVQLEKEGGVPRNPLINAGALVITDALVHHGELEAIEQLLRLLSDLSESEVLVDEAVADSERTWGHRNRSLAWFMKSFGVLRSEPNQVLNAYFRQCAVAMNTTQLAKAGRFLANEGLQNGRRVTTHQRVNRLNALMLTCGHYDMSGDFAFRVGLPGKSGVGGGIMAIAPGVASIAVWSPALNTAGNSLVGTLALERLSALSGINLF